MATTDIPRSLNKNNSAVKRIMQEARELANDTSTDYTAAPLDDDIFDWHCTLRGPAGTDFDGGLYHFRIVLPAEYPFRPPSVMMLTPSGRFELNTKICISFTNYHEELWQPAWGVRTAIVALQGFFPLRGTDAVGVGSLETTGAERRRLAALSRSWRCPRCERTNAESLPDPPAPQDGARDGGRTLGDAPRALDGAPHMATATDPATAPAPTPAQAPAPAPTPAPASAPTPAPHAEERRAEPALAPPAMPLRTAAAATAVGPSRTVHVPASARPPLLLDTAIGVFIVLILALLAKRLV